jgi:uncharacterized tellurite resistance protein B-like protein
MLNKIGDFLGSLVATPAPERKSEHTLQLATAVLLVEVMRSDASVAAEELAAVATILGKHFALKDAEVARLVELGRWTADEASDLYQFTSLLNRELGIAEKTRIVEYLWQVAYADRHLNAHENHLMRKIADLLHIPHGDYVGAKTRAKTAAGA